MKLLLPVGVLLIVIGAGGSIAACYGNAIFDTPESETLSAEMRGATDAPANESRERTPQLYLAPLAGLTLAVGLVCVGIGVGNWRRPVPSDVRPANPWNDQPAEHGDPPRGLV
jgi:hypothetical protein